jgi:outer membrane protein TolC
MAKMIFNHIIFFVIGLLIPLSVMSAETLEQAFAIAINNNYRIIATQIDNQVAEQQLLAAQGQRYPQVNISTRYTQLSEEPSMKASIGGQSTQFAMAQAGNLKAQAMVSVPLFTSGRIGHNIEAANAMKLATLQNGKTTTLAIKRQVANAFIAILRIEKYLEVSKQHVISLKAHANDVNHLYEQGMIARNDLLAAQVELSNANQQVLQQENQLNIAKAGFNQLLNRDLNLDVNLIAPFLKSPQDNLSDLNTQAVAQRPELKVLSQQINALEHQAASEKATLLPQVSFNGGYQYEENEYTVFESMWVANVTLQWKLYDGSTRHRSHATRQKSLSLLMQRSDLLGQIKLQIRQAWLAIQETRKRIDITTTAIDQADENLRISTERYQQGLTTNTEVLEAEDLRVQTNNNLNNAEYDLAMAQLNLRYALGIL